MKTAISIPDSIFHAAENLAAKLGISRSELFSLAISEYIKTIRYKGVTETLNDVYSQVSEGIDDDLASMQMESIPKEVW